MKCHLIDILISLSLSIVMKVTSSTCIESRKIEQSRVYTVLNDA
jgi:hypothetical protein